MNKIERLFLVVALVLISIVAISWIGREYFALLAMFDLLVGVIIGMIIFLPGRKSQEYSEDIITDLQFKHGKPVAQRIISKTGDTRAAENKLCQAKRTD